MRMQMTQPLPKNIKTERLVQFQCAREGTLFYYQTGMIQISFRVLCPVCGSQRTGETGRAYPPLDEEA